MQNNQQSYPSRGWSTYPDGTSANAQSEADMVPITDWVPGQEPSWQPIAGGLGFGTPQLSNGPPAGSGVAGVGTSEGNVTSAVLPTARRRAIRHSGGNSNIYS